MKQIINTIKSPSPIGPYNQAIIANNMLFISGQIGVDPISMKLKDKTIKEETDQVMINIKNILYIEFFSCFKNSFHDICFTSTKK